MTVDTVSIIKHRAKCGLKDVPDNNNGSTNDTYPAMDGKVLEKRTLLASLCTSVLCGCAL